VSDECFAHRSFSAGGVSDECKQVKYLIQRFRGVILPSSTFYLLPGAEGFFFVLNLLSNHKNSIK
jgi:hypothetical protein